MVGENRHGSVSMTNTKTTAFISAHKVLNTRTFTMKTMSV